jgi:hypothetical protein
MANLELSNLTAKQFVATSKTQAKTLDKDATKLQALTEKTLAGEVAPEALGKEIGMNNIKFSYSKEKFNLSFEFNGMHIVIDAADVNDAGEQLADILGDIVDNGGDNTQKSSKKKESYGDRWKREWKEHLDATGGHEGQQARYDKGTPPGAAAIGELIVVSIRALF